MSSERSEIEDRLLEAETQMAALESEVSRWRERATDSSKPSGMKLNAQQRVQSALDNVKAFKPQLDDLRLAKKRLDDSAAERAEAREAADRERDNAVRVALENAKAEDRSFWFRRFHTSLAIAHGAAFAAISSKLFDPAIDSATAGGSWYSLSLFAIGMLVAGLIPIFLFLEKTRWTWYLAIGSAVLFAMGLAAALIAIWIKADMVWPWQV